jgi:putative endonuclease
MSKRIKAHNEGKGASYTRSHGPVKPVYQERVGDYSEALKREAEIKKLSKLKKELLLINIP